MGEIVGAGHASTTGRFDDEQLFYLMSRGINAADLSIDVTVLDSSGIAELFARQHQVISS